MADGYAWRERRTWKKLAWVTAHLLSALSGKPVRPEDLIQLEPKADDPRFSLWPDPKTIEESAKMIDEWLAIHAMTRAERLERYPQLFRRDADTGMLAELVTPKTGHA
jgi:hypothetical protein